MENKKQWYGNYTTIEVSLTLDDARSGSHQGQCDDDIEALLRVPYIAVQVADWDPVDLARELGEYSDWDTTDHEKNLARMLWIACGDIAEENINE